LKVNDLREVFIVAARHYREDGKVETAEALSAFAANLLRANDDSTVAALVKRIEEGKKPARPAVRRSTKSQRSRTRGARSEPKR
jgi:hypothetical protein